MLSKEEIEKARSAGLDNYIEIEHAEQVKRLDNVYAFIDRIRIKRDRNFSCPVKTLALFAHNEEFSLLPEQVPGIVSLVAEKCLRKDDVINLSQSGQLPKMLTGVGKQSFSVTAAVDHKE